MKDCQITNIHVISELEIIVKNLGKGKRILIVFDLDDTLIKPCQTVGSDTWFANQIKTNSMKQVVNDLFYIYCLIRYKQVEPMTNQIIQNIRSIEGVDSLCMTSRNKRLYSHTLKHLEDSGLGFLIEQNILKTRSSTIHIPNPVMETVVTYIDNLVLCSGNNKGVVLHHLLKETEQFNDTHYTDIIVVDDSMKNITDMMNQLNNPILHPNTSLHLIYYQFMEEHKSRYSSHDHMVNGEKLREIIKIVDLINNEIDEQSNEST
jgi:hypothetical protein